LVLSRRGRQPFFVNWSVSASEARAKIDQFNIRGEADTAVEALSGGNQQRALLALLPPNLRLLALEHPTRGLDIESAAWIWQQLLSRRQEGTAILFISADLDELMQYADRIVVFSGGVMAPPIDAARTSVEQLGQLIGGIHAAVA
jgi:simple sugar transport system ATP-binding protein